MTSITFPPTFSQVEGTHLVFADFYEDKVVIRARDALNEKWISKGLTELTLKKKCPIADISVTKDGNILTAKCDTESVKFVWYLDGEAHEGKSITFDRDFDGFVAVRVYDHEGNYKSVVFDRINNI